MAYDDVPRDNEWREYRVAQGILVEGGRVLLSANRWFSDRPPVWTLPGGRAEKGEGIEEALSREYLEETGLTVQAAKLAFVAEARSSRSRRLFLSCAFTVVSVSGELNCQADPTVEELRFVPVSDLHLYITAPSLYNPLRWHLDNSQSPARYWFFPEYEA
jgi:8-oxo-dGTP diphosphatase